MRLVVVDWTVEPGDKVVYLPRMLLANARSRYSVECYLHAMALANAFAPRGVGITDVGDDRVTARLDRSAVARFVGATARHTVDRVLAEIPVEIDKDLPAWADTVVELAARMIRSPRHPRGRFTHATVTVVHRPLAEMEAGAAGSATWMAPVRIAVPGWEQKPPRPRHLRKPARYKPPAPIADVVPLSVPDPVPVPVISAPMPDRSMLRFDDLDPDNIPSDRDIAF